MAEVNDKGEVTVEGEFVGRLEGFRFRQDASGSPEEARTLRQAAVQSLRPEFHLRADRFYNSPDTELDFTEQGGLMWGTTAVGKLVKGADIARPQVEAFVDEEAGEEVAEKVRRRLQHFIDRRVAAQFEPMLAMSRDESLTGLARGFAFRLVEALGVLPRDNVTTEVKDLDQDARGALRKHGVRFGQFTIFLPLMLKPAPTRLRLVLWSLWNGLQEFPESPPPGLVTIPNLPDVPKQHYTLAGYHPAGARAIRIDMLERLADLLRAKDSRAGFEAQPEMLSITGMTLDHFAGLMAGLGYKGEKSERPKAKSAEPVIVVPPPDQPMQPIPEEVSLLNPAPEAEPASDEPAVVEMEQFYTFTWAPKPRNTRPERPARQDRAPNRGPNRSAAPAAATDGATAEAQPDQPRGDRPRGDRPRGDHPKGDRPKGDRPRNDRPQGERAAGDQPQGERQGGKPRHGKPDAKGGNRAERGKYDKSQGDRPQDKPRSFEARPPRAEKPIDPDNPFAVLAALKTRT